MIATTAISKPRATSSAAKACSHATPARLGATSAITHSRTPRVDPSTGIRPLAIATQARAAADSGGRSVPSTAKAAEIRSDHAPRSTRRHQSSSQAKPILAIGASTSSTTAAAKRIAGAGTSRRGAATKAAVAIATAPAETPIAAAATPSEARISTPWNLRCHAMRPASPAFKGSRLKRVAAALSAKRSAKRSSGRRQKSRLRITAPIAIEASVAAGRTTSVHEGGSRSDANDSARRPR